MKKLNLTFIKNLTLNKADKIFKKLPEEGQEKQIIPFLLNKQIKGAIALACATTLILSGSYSLDYLDSHENNVFSTDSFSILADGKELCKIRDLEQLDTALEELEYDLEEKHQHDLSIENNFQIEPSKAKDKEIISGEELYNILAENASYSILADAIKVDGNQVGVVNSELEAKNVVEKVKNYFTQNYDKESVIEVNTKEKVEISQIKASNTDIQAAEELANYIIKGTDEEQKYVVEEGDTYWTIAEYFNMSLDELISANPSSDSENIQIGEELNLVVPKPFINVQVKRKVTQEEKMPFETEYQYVSYMYNDEEVVERSGKYGISEIEAIITEQNGIQIAKETISESVISEPTTKIVTTGTQDPPPRIGTGTFINPLPGAMISSRFGSRSGGFHRGIDLAKATGSSIKATDGGTVISAGWDGSYGYSILINHGGGYSSRYAHCSDMYVSAGDKVYQGQIIAAVGSTGVSTGPHLHFEIMKYGSVVNPASYIY
ncbi:MAG: peptidoglycan DD-metalloendopeptidase family protein [Sedimentibacter sp.]|uniref:peptidoglycan DD-metalloendopeptidase family protein n=1 Tax=Sedimentibacter sp. TaxID=1960295 RepID=UPI00298148D1|nr:peptidoglycan DD-metalloendopeptidase family protein [Sedimentibacter sp.]MDW5299397.1 peptidoglycan DD-metalloendopeptidase family protein [Sedimentibacter sp.]